MKIIWFGLVLMCYLQNVASLRILGIFPINGKSHSLIQQTVMKGLAAKGHQVDVYSHFPSKKPIPNYTDFSLQGTLPSTLNNMDYLFIKEMSKSFSMRGLVTMLGNKQCELLELPIFQKMLKDKPKYDVVVIEVFFANCYLALGRYFDAPLVGIVGTAVLPDWVNPDVGNPVNLATDVSFISPNTGPLSFFERLANVFMYNYVSVSANYHLKEQNKYVEKYFGSGYPDVQEMQKDLSLVLLNYNSAVFGNRAFAPAVVPVGGIHVIEDDEALPKEVQKWLDEATNGFIYFTFGSMVKIESFPREVLDAFYETFKRIAPVRVLIKIAKVKDLPPGLPSNVMTQPWFSQVKVLKHKNLKLFVTHGGLLGTTEAIYHGVPLIGIPLFGDQVYNIKTYVNRGIAIKLDVEEITTESFTNAVTELLNNPSYKKNAVELARKFKDQLTSPMERAVFSVEYVARNGKNALRSPSVDLCWCQNNLLDVYGLILGAVLIVIFLLRKLMQLYMSCFCSQHKVAKQKVKKN